MCTSLSQMHVILILLYAQGPSFTGCCGLKHSTHPLLHLTPLPASGWAAQPRGPKWSVKVSLTLAPLGRWYQAQMTSGTGKCPSRAAGLVRDLGGGADHHGVMCHLRSSPIWLQPAAALSKGGRGTLTFLSHLWGQSIKKT